MMTARTFLSILYMDWRNNWLSIDKFAEYHGLEPARAAELVALARLVFDSKHPDA
jgi:hypothetical protein